MRVAVLVKQVPVGEQLRLEAGRLVRTGVDLEVNAYCRRANAKALELADDEVVVFTMGPPTADEALREMIACGATRGVHLCDSEFAGADTLATARALAAAIRAEGPFDLILCGLNSVDADTGQVGPQVAALLGIPFAPGVSQLEVGSHAFHATLEMDDGYRFVTGALPAMMSTSERLCDPSKAPPERRALVSAELIRRVSRRDLDLGCDEVGGTGSPTSVGPVELLVVSRAGHMTADVDEAFALLKASGALRPDAPLTDVVAESGGAGPEVWCLCDPQSIRIPAELLGEAAALAARLGGSVTAIVTGDVPAELGSFGADHVMVAPSGYEPDQLAEVVGAAAAAARPAALLVDGTRTGRVVASTIAATHGWGLTGDAIALNLSKLGRLVCWKPAFGGQLIAPIESRSAVQMATVRPGVLPRRRPRPARKTDVRSLALAGPSKLSTIAITHVDNEAVDLLQAPRVIGVGNGVAPQQYELIEPLRLALGGAPLAATRKVTDRGWLPRSRQVGVTGHAIAPRLYVAIGISGKFNHMVGVRNAGVVLAINADASAPIFDHCDVGLVMHWPAAVEALVTHLDRLHDQTWA